MVFTRALEALPTIQTTHFRAWLFTIAHHTVVDTYRRSPRMVDVTIVERFLPTPSDDEAVLVPRLDDAETEVEEECLHALALYQPVAFDLRYLVQVLKINHDLERIGDHAVNIAQNAQILCGQPSEPSPPRQPSPSSSSHTAHQSASLGTSSCPASAATRSSSSCPASRTDASAKKESAPRFNHSRSRSTPSRGTGATRSTGSGPSSGPPSSPCPTRPAYARAPPVSHASTLPAYASAPRTPRTSPSPAYADTRQSAIARTYVALTEMVVDGIRTNLPLHLEVMQHSAFKSGGTDIHYLEKRLKL